MNRNELINYIILNSKISLEDIAQNIGVNRSNIYLWRTNKTTPKIEYVNKMADLAGITLKWINQDEIIIGNTDSDYTEMKNDSSKDKIISLQDGTIKLLEEKIETLKKKLDIKSSVKNPAYHFEIRGKYIQKTDTWHDAKISGDISMLGFSKDEIEDILKMENNNPRGWINRYHPDSYERLHDINWQNTKSDYQHISWRHMMWQNKNGQYLCFNIQMHYDRKAKNVITLFYYVNGDDE